MNIIIDQISKRYINQIVSLHINAFPNFFLTFLGPGFLKEFYTSFIYDDNGLGYVAIDTESKVVCGVVVGPVNPRGYFKRLLIRRFWAFCLASTKAILRKPSVIRRLFRAIFYRGDSPPGPTRALLSSIAVSPDVQGKGVGKALMKRWMEEAASRGARGCYLTTDTENNDFVNNFYHAIGWRIDSTFVTREGRKMNCYIYDFNKKWKK